MRVFYSHIGEEELKDITEFEEIQFEGQIKDLIELINLNRPGFKNLILDRNNKIKSSVALYKNVIEEDQMLLDDESTQVIKDISEYISNNENILISIFDPKKIGNLLELTIKDIDSPLKYRDPKELDLKTLKHKMFLNEIDGPVEEQVMIFESGETTLKDLRIEKGGFIEIKFTENDDDVLNLFDRKNSKLLPSQLLEAIRKIWDLSSDEVTLYYHQEDCLFYILGKLRKPNNISKEALLLAIPTGGGKTEAFLIPVISHIHDKKNKEIKMGNEPKTKISTIITYPTKALANDQANRIIEILNEVNKESNFHQQITIGVLTGDTPKWGGYELKEKSIVQLCPNCQSPHLEYLKSNDDDGKKNYIRCLHCDKEIYFVRLTREDIFSFPPDILVTNLDMINFCLQSPKMRTLFQPEKIDFDLMIFDEVHLCESVFGCHTGHLLRRLEATTGKKPLYVGVSATINNAEELSSLIFNVDKQNILYLNDTNRPYLKSDISHYKYHYVLTPFKWKDPDRYLQVVTSALNVVDVIGHSIKDPHFRKTLVFSNFRQDTDNLVKYLRDQEDRYFKIYKEEVFPKISTGQTINKSERNVAESVGGWYEYLHKNGMLYGQKLEVGWHRGGLEQKERLRAINRFSTTNKLAYDNFIEMPVDVMMATNTLELGIDIGNVTNVLNCSAPFTVNEYVQRSGRGGRKKDSSTLTLIDPTNPLDFYLKQHFHEYVIPEKRNFEDAPIIISNKSIIEVHLWARILDFLADLLIEQGEGNHNIKVEYLKNLKFTFNGELVEFMEYPEIFGEAVFVNMLKERYILDVNKNQVTALELYQEWFKREHDILGIKQIDQNEEDYKNIIISKCRELRDKIKSDKFNIHGDLGGMSSEDNSLVPKMRGSGPTCNIILIRDRGEEIKDSVSRRRAMTNMPPGGYTTQGANTFEVDDIVNDPEAERNVRNLLNKNKDAFNFFIENFKEYFPENILDLDLNTPKDLKVRYYPFRFYCAKCGKTYTKTTNDDRCIKCKSELRQLTELYLCEDKDCGEIFAPPVPRVCINPNHLKNDKRFMESLNKGPRPEPDYELFRFNALPKLEWQCRVCKTNFNFHNKFIIDDLPESFIAKPPIDLAMDKSEDVAKHYQYYPEAFYGKRKYKNKGFNLSSYRCDACGKYNTIRVKNIPTVRNVVVEYIIYDRDMMDFEKLDIGNLEFKYVSIIELSRNYSRKFYRKEKMEVKTSEIFPANHYSYLTNNYSTHAALMKIQPELIENFIETQTQCLTKKCSDCDLIKKLQDSSISRPNLELEPWETEKTPDIRKKWCEKTDKCTKTNCSDCPDYSRKKYLKYLLIHAIKHALIISMPKYLGVNKNEIRGIIHPNDDSDIDILFLDVHEDGSGAIYLMKRNWEKIWDLSEELLQNVKEGKGTLLIPQFCARHNLDLCPFIGSNFYEYLNEINKR